MPPNKTRAKKVKSQVAKRRSSRKTRTKSAKSPSQNPERRSARSRSNTGFEIGSKKTSPRAARRAAASDGLPAKNYRDLFETMALGVVYQDRHGRIIAANKAAESILGLTLGRMRGRTSADPRWKAVRADGSPFPGDGHPAMVALRTGKAVHNVVMGVLHPKEGAHRWILVSAIPQFKPRRKRPYQVYTTFSDVTEQKRAEEALLLTRHAMDHSHDAIAWVGPDARFLYVNDAACRSLGYTRDELLTMAAWDVDAHMKKATAPEYWDYVRQHGTLTFETEHRRKDGRLIPVEVVVSYLVREGQEYFVANARDISERKGMEADRDNLFDVSMDLISIGGFDGYFRQVNPAWTRTLGWSQEEMLARPWLDFVHPEDRETTIRADEILREGEPTPAFENRFMCKDGSYRWLSWNSVPQKDAGRVYAAARDITERKKIDENLEREKRFLRQVIDATPSFIAVKDQDSRFVLANKALAEAYGTTVENLIGKSDADFNSNHEEVAKFSRDDRRAIETREPLHIGEEQVTYSDGQVHWVTTTKVPLIEPDGSCTRLLVTAADVTDRKQSEASLTETRALLQAVVAQSPIPMVVAKPDGTVSIFNQACREILGIEDESGIRLGANLFEFTQTWKDYDAEGHPVSLDDLPLARALRGESTKGRELRIVRKDGTERWETVHGVPIYGEDGALIAGFIVFPDITERKDMEGALRESEAKYRRLHESMRDAFASVDMNGRIVESNPAYQSMLGYSADELRNLAYDDITPERWHAAEARIVEEQVLKRGYSDVYEKEYRRKDGTVFPVELRSVLIRQEDGTPVGIWAAIRDITERKRAEVALQENEATLSSIFKAVPVGIGLVSGRRLLRVNDCLCEMVGYSREELIGETTRLLYPSDEEYEDIGREKYRRLATEGSATAETRWKHKNGNIIDVLLNLSPFDPKDPSAGVTLTAMDITERKRAEAALRESEMRYRAVIETTNTGFVILDEDGRVCDANAEFVRLTGRESFEGVLGHAVTEWTAPHDLERNAREVQRCLETGFVRHLDIDYVGPSGRVIPVEVNATAVVTAEGARIISICRDVTQRKQAEDALRKSSHELQLMINNMINAFVVFESVFDENGAYVSFRFGYFNEAFSIISKLTLEDVRGKDVFEVWPGTEQSWLEVYGQVAVTGVPKTFDMYHEPTKGRYHCNAYRPSDSPDRICVIFEDITERSRAEAALRESEERFRTIFDSINDAIFVHHLETGAILEVNGRMCEMFGYSRAEACSLTVGDISLNTPPFDQTHAVAWMQKAAAGEPQRFDWLCRARDDRLFWAEVNMHRVRIGGQDRVLVVARDISERKRAEEALKASEARLASILRAVPLGVCLARDRVMLEFNDGYHQMVGYSAEELIGQKTKMLYVSDKENERVGRELYGQIERDGVSDIETRWRRKDGSELDILIRGSLLDPTDPKAGIAFAVLDITERKRIEEVLRLNESRLEALIELNQMREESDQDMVRYAMDQAIRLTQSQIGYVAFTNEDESVLTMHAWSHAAMEECKITEKPLDYPVETTGLWGEAIRQRKPVITNDYAAPSPFKRGYPEGHVQVTRHMNVPVFDGDHIVIVAGVGNKDTDYDQADVRQLTLLMSGMWRILQRKRAEMDLLREKQFSEKLLESLPGIFFLYDPTCHLKRWNKAHETAMGFTADELRDWYIPDWHETPEDAAIGMALVKKVLETGVGGSFETTLINKEGRFVPYLISITRLVTPDGPFMMGVGIDITDRKQVEEALRESESRLSALFAAIMDAVYVFEIAPDGSLGTIIETNDMACRMLGYTRNEMLGLAITEIDAPESPVKAGTVVNRLKEEHDVVFEQTHVTKDGRRIPVEIHACTFDLKGSPAILAMARDITERKRVEQALQSRLVAMTRPLDDPSSIAFTDLFDVEEIQKIQDAFAASSGAAALITEPDGKPITRPSGFSRLCAEFIRQSEKGVHRCQASDMELGKVSLDGPTVRRCLSAGLLGAGASITVGGKHIASWLIGQVRNESLDLEQTARYAQEIDADPEEFRKALLEVPVMSEQQFRKVADTLWILSQELSIKAYQNVQQARFIADLKRAEEDRERLVRELELKNAELEGLVYVASHDLRSPLVNILGFSSEMERASLFLSALLRQPEVPAQVREHAEPYLKDHIPTAVSFIKASGQKMDALIEGLLRLSRTGRATLNLTHLDMNAMIENAVASMTYQIQQASAKIDIQPLPPCRGDEDQINQVFSNILDNALKYRSPDRPLEIRISGGVEGDRAVYCVEDNGIGIAAGHEAKIWELFHRLYPTGPVPGEGLGLTLVRRIVDRHGGRAWVESEPGVGSRFCVALPSAER